MKSLSEYWTIPMVAKHLSCSTRWVRDMVHEGKFSALRMGKKFRVDISSVQKWIEANKVS
jgi:excisionase family DNA binding protein